MLHLCLYLTTHINENNNNKWIVSENFAAMGGVQWDQVNVKVT